MLVLMISEDVSNGRENVLVLMISEDVLMEEKMCWC